MSDERWKTDSDDAPASAQSSKPTFKNVKPAYVTADDIETFIVRFCKKMGIPLHSKLKEKPAQQEQESPNAPTAEDWDRVLPKRDEAAK
jgi:hypothetical protein